MVKVIQLQPGGQPPSTQAFVLIEWSTGSATSFSNEGRRLHYVIGKPKHRFWSTEAILMAARLGFEEIYYIGQPSEFAAPFDTKKYLREPTLKRRDHGARRQSVLKRQSYT